MVELGQKEAWKFKGVVVESKAVYPRFHRNWDRLNIQLLVLSSDVYVIQSGLI